MYNLNLDFYKIKVKIISNTELVLEEIKRDFSYFLSDNNTYDIKIETFNQSPPYELVPQIKASLYLPNAIAYDYNNARYIDYNGKTLTIYNYDKEEGYIYSEDKNLLHEISYLLLLSRVGELLDRKGIHRIHGLALGIDAKVILCLLPMGAGKTTLALDLLKDSNIKLLSDDVVLVTRKGKILPFPLRIGVNKDVNLDIPQNYLRTFYRRQYGPKVLVDIEYFKDKIAKVCSPWIILIGERQFSPQAKIEPLAKHKAIWPFIQNGVIGLGLPQIVEYFLRNTLRDFKKLPILLSRICVCLKIIFASKVYKFTIGQNKEENIKILLDFLTKRR